MPVRGHRDLSPLLRHHDAERIGSLRQSQSGGVSGPPRPELGVVARQGEVDREALDLGASQDHGTVVTRRAGVEQAQQDRLAELAVQWDPPLDVTLEVLRPGDDQQRAGPGGREVSDCPEEQIGHSRSHGLWTTSQAPGADLFEETPQVLLEDHHHDDDQDGEEALQDSGGDPEPQLVREEVDDAEDGDTGQGHPRSGAPQQHHRRPEERGDHRHVRDVQKRQAEEGFTDQGEFSAAV